MSAADKTTLDGLAANSGVFSFTSGQLLEDDSGTEVLLPEDQWSVYFNPIVVTFTFILNLLASSASGTGHMRVRVGGTPDTVDGTVVVDIPIIGAMAQYSLSGPFSNPGTPALVKVSIQASSLGNNLQVKGRSGVIK